MKDNKKVLLVSSGDLRLSANQQCWPEQAKMEARLGDVVKGMGYSLKRAHPYKKEEKHGFISSQKEGMEVFAKIDRKARLIVAESVWQYSHHVLAGLISHEGPILTLANWSGTWPGLVGMLNLNGSLTKARVKYTTIWSEEFTDQLFKKCLNSWLAKGTFKHKTDHVKPLSQCTVPTSAKRVAKSLATELRTHKAIMGVFDEGCMGMYNAIIPDELLFSTGVYKERLSQSALFAAMNKISLKEANEVYKWLEKKGFNFHCGKHGKTALTKIPARALPVPTSIPMKASIIKFLIR